MSSQDGPCKRYTTVSVRGRSFESIGNDQPQSAAQRATWRIERETPGLCLCRSMGLKQTTQTDSCIMMSVVPCKFTITTLPLLCCLPSGKSNVQCDCIPRSQHTRSTSSLAPVHVFVAFVEMTCTRQVPTSGVLHSSPRHALTHRGTMNHANTSLRCCPDCATQVKHPLARDTAARLAGCHAEVVLTHLNHTNPLLTSGSPQRQQVLAAGVQVMSAQGATNCCRHMQFILQKVSPPSTRFVSEAGDGRAVHSLCISSSIQRNESANPHCC